MQIQPHGVQVLYIAKGLYGLPRSGVCQHLAGRQIAAADAVQQILLHRPSATAFFKLIGFHTLGVLPRLGTGYIVYYLRWRQSFLPDAVMQDNRILHQRFTAQHRQGRQGGLQSRLRLLRQVCLCHAVGTALRVFVIQKKRSDQIDVVDFPALRCKADDPGKHRGYRKANRAIGGGDMRFDRLTASLPQQQTAEKEASIDPETLASSDSPDISEESTSPQQTPVTEENTPNNPLSRMRQLFSNITDKVNTNLTSSATTEEPGFIQEQSGHILTAAERESLADLFSDFTDSDKLLADLRNGSATARELLGALHSALPKLSDSMIRDLFANPSLGKLIKGQFLSNWTISPEGLKESNSMDSLYHKISSELDNLLHLSQMFATRPSGESAVNTTNDMQQNLQFMKTLNEQFAYMQLPLKLSSENTHGDLYVMTKKETLRKSKDNLKVLLHLEMDHLGPLDIHITKDHTNISTKFFVSKDNALRLLEKNVGLLKDALNEQGYSFSSEFAEKKKDIDLVHDFIETEAPVGNITRYNFDLRA